MTELLALLSAVLLLAGNAFFVGAEFALISARRDRLETLAAGTGRTALAARTVLRATGRLPQMLAASQLAITVFSLLLGRLGEPAVARLLERPMNLVGLPPDLVPPIALVVALLLVVVGAHAPGRDGAPQHRPRRPRTGGDGPRAAVPAVHHGREPARRTVQPVRAGGAPAAARATPGPSSMPRSPPASSP